MRFKDKVIIITGAGQGIGRVLANALAREGAKIVISEINETNARAVAGEITGLGFDAIAIKTDVADEREVNQMVSGAVEKYGRVDVLVNNAGILSTIRMKPFWEISAEEWDRVLAVNLKGMFLCCKAVVPVMQKQKKGKIINMSSTTVLEGRPNYLHYVSSKAGVIGLTRAMAREVGDWNINVNAITPGATDTGIPRDSVSPQQQQAMIAQRCIKRKEVPQDLVGTVMFLASEESDFISGQVINVDGGFNMY